MGMLTLPAAALSDARDGAENRRETMSEIKTLSLMKGKQHFCFRYQPGDEAHVLDALVDMVNRRELSFDWFDAAVMSHQLGQH
jgi:hypothetical protein